MQLLEQVELSEDIKEKSKLLYDLAKARKVALSRDEAAEMFVNQAFSEEAHELWKREGEYQLATRKMNQAASKGQLDHLKVSQPLKSYAPEVLGL